MFARRAERIDQNHYPLPIPMNARKTHLKGTKQSRPYIYYAHIQKQNSHNQEEEDVSIQYQIEKIQAHRLRNQSESAWRAELSQMPLHQIPNSELQFLVKWIGHEQRSWQPGQNLKNAPLISESYKKNYHQNKSMSTSKPYSGKPRGRKPKNASGNAGSSSSAKGTEFDFGNVYKRKNARVKGEEDGDEVEIIAKEDYIKATRQFSRSLVVQAFGKRALQESKQSVGRNSWDSPVQEHRAEMLEQIIEGRPQIFQEEQPRERENLLENNSINQELIAEEDQINDQGANMRLNDRSIMVTQKEKHIQNQEAIHHQPLAPIEEENEPIGGILQGNFLDGDRLIDLFIDTHKITHQIEQVHHNQPQSLFWPQNEGYYIQGQAHNQHVQLPVQEEPNHQQEKQEQVILPKRVLSQQGHVGLHEILSKRIKQNEVVPQSILKQYGLGPHKNQKAIVIEIEDNDPEPFLSEIKASQPPEINTGLPLKYLIEKEVNTILTKDNQSVQEILEIHHQPSLTPAVNLKIKKQSCFQCKIHQQYNGQLRHLFTEYIQNNQEISLDNLFLEQETFSVLSTLNPASFNQSNFLRVDKMADITDKEPLCSLISRKIAKREEVQRITKDFKPSKLVKIRDEWLCIMKTDSLGEGRQEHFKYVKADHLIQLSRKMLVSFLTN